MNKQVFITIEGQQIGSDEAPIIMNARGIYHRLNGKHYVQYDEKLEDSTAVSKNTIKIEASKVILSKKLIKASEMVFDLKEITAAPYPTLYGNLTFEIRTYTILLKEETDRIELYMEYSLSSDQAPVSDNSISIVISSSEEDDI